MRSAGTPTATVLTVVTLVFAPVLKHGHTTPKVVAKDTTSVTVECYSTPASKCPGRVRMHESMNAPDATSASVQAAIAASIVRPRPSSSRSTRIPTGR